MPGLERAGRAQDICRAYKKEAKIKTAVYNKIITKATHKAE